MHVYVGQNLSATLVLEQEGAPKELDVSYRSACKGNQLDSEWKEKGVCQGIKHENVSTTISGFMWIISNQGTFVVIFHKSEEVLFFLFIYWCYRLRSMYVWMHLHVWRSLRHFASKCKASMRRWSSQCIQSVTVTVVFQRRLPNTVAVMEHSHAACAGRDP